MIHTLHSAAITRDALAAFRATQPDCVLALWADIEARLVLVADSDLRHPQEALDALGRVAACVLGAPEHTPSGDGPESAVFQEPTGNSLFLRDAKRAPHVLVCTSGPGLDPDDLLSAMAAFIAALAPGAGEVAQ